MGALVPAIVAVTLAAADSLKFRFGSTGMGGPTIILRHPFSLAP
jgi:hypothetical protein